MEYCLKYAFFLVAQFVIGCVDFISFQSPWITIFVQFGGPWDPVGTILVIKWDTDALEATLEGPRMDFG